MSVERVAYGAVLTAGTEVSVLTVPRHSRIVLASLVLTNTGSSAVEVTVRVSVADRKFRVLPPGLVIQPADSFHLITPISVEANESLTVEASEAGVVEYYVTGLKEPAVPSASDRAA